MFKRKLFSTLLVSLMLTTISFAQTSQPQSKNYSDDILEEYVKVDKQLKKTRKNLQGKILQTIKDNGMEVSRYQEIYRARQKDEKIDYAEGEKASFDKIQSVATSQQKKMNNKVGTIFKDSELDRRKYNEIRKASTSDKKLQKRIQKIGQK